MADIHPIKSPTEVGLRMGAEGSAVEDLQLYLRRFGYLPVDEADEYEAIRVLLPTADPIPGRFDDVTLGALRAYQDFHGLPPTGELDDATVAQMAIPRCGVPDIWDADAVAAFVAEGSRWPTNGLRYGFQNFTPDVPQADIRAVVAAALALWSRVTPLTFVEVPLNQNPEILIRFVAGNHGDGTPFAGVGGVLAHAFFPPDGGGSGGLAGDAHFDEAETWSAAIPVPMGRFDLMTLAAHEFGHSLGLDHSTVPGAIMRPFFAPGAAQRFLTQDDIDGIQSIYGIGTTVPFVRELPVANAVARVHDAGLIPRFTGTSGSQAWVWRQSPQAGTVVRRGSLMTLQLRTGPIP
jgi:peptidoglycan hydrolase-like protein with peptidoglycan-binding domain